jgi:hypothetical protein
VHGVTAQPMLAYFVGVLVCTDGFTGLMAISRFRLFSPVLIAVSA